MERIEKETSRLKYLIFNEGSFRLFSKIVLLFSLVIIWFIFTRGTFEHEILGTIAKVIFYYLLINIFFSYGSNIMIYVYRKRNNFDYGYKNNTIIGINRLSFLLNNLFFFFVLLKILGINLSEILTSLSIIAVAIVLTFKEFISNFLNGIYLMFSRNLNIKDYVKVGEQRGRITNFTFQNIELKTESGDYIYIPNNLIQSREMTNYSRESLKNATVDISLTRVEAKKLNKIELEIRKCVEKSELVLSKNKDSILIKTNKIEKDLIHVTITVSVDKHSFEVEEEVKQIVNSAVLKIILK